MRDAFCTACATKWFTWEMRTWARLTHKAGRRLIFTTSRHVPPRPDRDQLGAYHAAEILYVFDNLGKSAWKLEPVDRDLSAAMSDCWIRFAATGDPNGGGLPDWQPYDDATQPYLEFGDSIQSGAELLQPECDFYDAYMATRRTD